MKIVESALSGVVLLEPTVHEDDRGSFYESFNKGVFRDLTGFDGEFVQDNHSTSSKDTLRGIHYQLPKPQGKLVRCIAGAVWDVAVDLRRSSPTFRQWRGYQLTVDNRRQLWIPEGFGHGFVVMTDLAEVLYKTTEFWDSGGDRAIRWDDPDLGVDWPVGDPPVLSRKDSQAPPLSEATLFD